MFDRLQTEPVYNTRAVAQKTGVPADTFRAWERRYKLPIPCRSGGNQRLYCERDVAIITWLRDQTRAGMTISHAVAFFNALDQNDQRNQGQHAPMTADVASPEPPPSTTLVAAASSVPRASFFHTCHELIDALSNFDAPRAERVLEELIAVSSVETVCHEVFRPTTSEIRLRRCRGVVDASVERFAHAFLKRKINALFNLSHPEIGRGPIIAAGVEGDHDELDLLYISLFLSRNGFSVIYLGADIATIQLQYAVTALNPLLVLLNASTESSASALEHAIRTLRPDDASASSPVIGFTGEIFAQRPQLRGSIHAPYFGSDGYHVVAACDRLLQGAILSHHV
jgi:DNA-binding transcriptional MerR regulator